eukprot:356174-Chlamydomonas_euryale.AAC.19
MDVCALAAFLTAAGWGCLSPAHVDADEDCRGSGRGGGGSRNRWWYVDEALNLVACLVCRPQSGLPRPQNRSWSNRHSHA